MKLKSFAHVTRRDWPCQDCARALTGSCWKRVRKSVRQLFSSGMAGRSTVARAFQASVRIRRGAETNEGRRAGPRRSSVLRGRRRAAGFSRDDDEIGRLVGIERQGAKVLVVRGVVEVDRVAGLIDVQDFAV